MNNLPVEIIAQFLKCLPGPSHLFHSIQSFSAMNNAFREQRSQILTCVFSNELLEEYANNGYIPFGLAHMTLQRLKSSCAKIDAVSIGRSIWQTFLSWSISPDNLHSLGEDLIQLYDNNVLPDEAHAVMEKMWQTKSGGSLTLTRRDIFSFIWRHDLFFYRNLYEREEYPTAAMFMDTALSIIADKCSLAFAGALTLKGFIDLDLNKPKAALISFRQVLAIRLTF